MTVSEYCDVRLLECADQSVPQAYMLFEETIGSGKVEDADSFRSTVSPLTDPSVAPKLVASFVAGRLIGAMLGVYLRKTNGCMILYAGVREPFRGQRVYTRMREFLMQELASESETHLGFVMSEVEDGGWLYRKYLDEWGGFAAPIDYSQPSVQGLRKRQLRLVAVPISSSAQEIRENLPSVLHDVFTSIYRIPYPELHPCFRRAVASLGRTP